MTDRIRVVVVDDQQLLRRGLSMLLGTDDGIEVVGEAGDGHEALAVIAASTPDVVLTDARMPGLDGLGLLAACARRHPELPVVLLTTFDDEGLVQGAIEGGAAGFLLKDCSVETLGETIRQAVAGGLVIDPRVARTALSRSRPDVGALAALTATELQVAELVATGATNAEIATRLHLAEGTVKNHVSALLRKLEQRDRTGLALLLTRELADPR
ncbi:MAG: response regulator transcription factor [Micropruina sp.]|uniref:response regulator n=1 Tax=Micropruina sp. TaxID=2737536 RepID=UPI0039E5255B